MHNYKDKRHVKKVKDYLNRRGIYAWLDEAEILPGDFLIDKIQEALMQDCSYVIVFISLDSLSSNWVKTELRWALTRAIEKKDIKIIPVKLDCEVIMPTYLCDRAWCDLSEEANWEREAERLVMSLTNSGCSQVIESTSSSLPGDFVADAAYQKDIAKRLYHIAALFFVVSLLSFFFSFVAFEISRLFFLASLSAAGGSYFVGFAIVIYATDIGSGNVRLIAGLNSELPNPWIQEHRYFLKYNMTPRLYGKFMFSLWAGIGLTFLLCILCILCVYSGVVVLLLNEETMLIEPRAM